MSSAAQNQSSRCDDSVLSIAANIAGVLTFAYALTAGLAFYYHSYVDSARQIRELLSYLRNSTFDIISPSSDFWSFRTIPSTIEGRQLRKIQKNTGTAAHKQVKNLEQLAHRSLKGHNQVLRFRGRGRFVLSRQKLMEERAAVEKSLQTFYSATIRCV
ncbi:MAG: hypothetical protein LQ349_000183 [Xanthoria aureola]|nr:MAG: hypothetical protein LQ349_000183 [Xanthoria aureola]